MKYILLLVVMIVVASCRFDSHPLKGGYAITVDGDTIPFYGGTITIGSRFSRDIRYIKIKDE